MRQKKILVIKFGGLGDVILSLNAIFSLKKKFNVKPYLLTEKPYDDFFLKSKWFDEIITIKRSLFYLYDLIQIKKKLNPQTFYKVFDLQTSRRSSYYLKIFNKNCCEINGIGKFSNVVHSNKNRNNLHTIERQKDQLRNSGIKFFTNPNLSWLYNEKKDLNFKNKKIAILVPGGSKKRLNKRIPEEVFIRVTNLLSNNKILPILLGSKDDFEVCEKIKKKNPEVLNLCNKTNFFQIANLSKKAILSVGNDTGPMHIISRGDNKTFVLFTKNSDPSLCRPTGKKVEILKFDNNTEKISLTLLKKINEII